MSGRPRIWTVCDTKEIPLPNFMQINLEGVVLAFEGDAKEEKPFHVKVIEKSAYEKAVEALKKIGFCECDAQWSGKDESQYRALGCPSCTCKPDWMIAIETLKELGCE